jgi:AbrB family looped-hinge helix DNA binding protein
MTSVVKVSQKGWLVIPAELRKKYGIKPGTSVTFVDYGGVLALVPVPEKPEQVARGFLKEYSVVGDLLAARREERAREDVRAR